jgi:hypothetical protein
MSPTMCVTELKKKPLTNRAEKLINKRKKQSIKYVEDKKYWSLLKKNN